MYHDLWYALPLIVSVSLVYAATRHESMSHILQGAVRVSLWFGGFVGGLTLLIYLISAWAA